MKINKIVIWGHKLHSHTHSYIHNGFFIGFKHIGFDTYWFDDNDIDKITNIDFSNSLFITEHQVNKKIPLRNDCLYLTHYVDDGDYKGVPKENIIMLKVSLRDFVEMDSKDCIYDELKYGRKFEYYSKIDGYNCLYMYWATDLLPNEIDENISKIDKMEIKKEINFVGSMTHIWNECKYICNMNDIKFNNYGATFNINSNNNISIKDNIKLTKSSIIAPALQDNMQVKKMYIPCRIFKNISYGKMGITNNAKVNELFDNKLIYDDNVFELLKKGIEFENLSNKYEIIVNLMDNVKNNHTYISRIDTIKKYINQYTTFQIE